MNLYEALQDIGKGRFYDTGCDYELSYIASGKYVFEMERGGQIVIILDGSPAENADKIKRLYYEERAQKHPAQAIIRAEYHRLPTGKYNFK